MRVSRQRSSKSQERRRSASKRFALDGALTILEARAGQRSLSNLIERGCDEVDASALRSIDTAGLQLLLAAGRAARERGLTLKVFGARALLLDAALSLGLGSALTEVVELP